MDLLEGDVLADRFRIVRLKGRGGMGEVYEAEDLDLHERVALKIIRPEIAADAKNIERFKLEIQLSRKVTHPNVCRVFDFVHQPATATSPEISFLTMELLEGETLAARLMREGPIELGEAMPLARQIIDGLAAAHAAGVTHGDFKTANVMLVEGRAVVLDFGLSRTAGTRVEGPANSISGTPAYMAPEQFDRRDLTPAADVYALGVVLYEMVTGRVPLSGETPLELVFRRMREKPVPPRSLASRLDENWNRAILRCLERKPEERFADARAVLFALNEKRGTLQRHRRTALVAGCICAGLAGLYLIDSRSMHLLSGGHVLPLYVADTQGRALSGVRIAVTGESAAVETKEGRAQIPLRSGTRPKSWVTISIVEPNSLVLISPWDGRVQVPASANTPQSTLTVILGQRGQRRLLEDPAAVRAIVQRINEDVARQMLDKPGTPEKQKALEQVTEKFGLDAGDVDSAIRAWGEKAEDPYDKGLLELYARDYRAASRELSASVDLRRQRASKLLAELVDANISYGQSLYGEGRFKAAAAAYEDADRHRPDDAGILNAWAASIYRAGEYKAAEPLYRRAIEMRERVLGPDHPDVATSLNDLAVLLKTEGDYAGAEVLYRRAMSIREKKLGPADPALAESLINLGMLLRARGELASAEPLYRRGQAIMEKALPADHPDLAFGLNAIAALLAAKGDFAGAEPLYLRALSIREKRLGPDHPNTLISVNNLATMLRMKGDYAGAEALCRRGLASKEKSLGPEHPSVATALANLGLVLKDRKDYSAADSQFRRALRIREKKLKAGHADVAESLTQLGALLAARGNLTGAEPFLRQALAIDENVRRPEQLARTLNSLGELLHAKRDDVQAEPLLRRALAIREKTLGVDHPEVAETLTVLGVLLRDRGDRAAAELTFRRALAIRERATGLDPRKVREALLNLGNLLKERGDRTNAETMLRRAGAIEARTASAVRPKDN